MFPTTVDDLMWNFFWLGVKTTMIFSLPNYTFICKCENFNMLFKVCLTILNPKQWFDFSFLLFMVKNRQMFWHWWQVNGVGDVIPPHKLLGVWPWNFYQMSIPMKRCKICEKIEISHLVRKLWVCKVQKRSKSPFLEMYLLGVVT